jgi:hypothetical protein
MKDGLIEDVRKQMDGASVKLCLGWWDSNIRFILFSTKLGQY